MKSETDIQQARNVGVNRNKNYQKANSVRKTFVCRGPPIWQSLMRPRPVLIDQSASFTLFRSWFFVFQYSNAPHDVMGYRSPFRYILLNARENYRAYVGVIWSSFGGCTNDKPN